jgi:hypothetical protein
VRKWLIGGLTGFWLVWELIAAFDGNDGTYPLTQFVTEYVPWWIGIPAAVVLAGWLVPHFISNYRRKSLQGRPLMVNNLPVPPDANADARNRAARTFVQGLLTDVIGAVAMAVGPALAGADFAWTKQYWTAVGLLTAKTIVLSVVSYVSRKVAPPAFD